MKRIELNSTSILVVSISIQTYNLLLTYFLACACYVVRSCREVVLNLSDHFSSLYQVKLKRTYILSLQLVAHTQLQLCLLSLPFPIHLFSIHPALAHFLSCIDRIRYLVHLFYSRLLPFPLLVFRSPLTYCVLCGPSLWMLALPPGFCYPSLYKI